MIPNNISKQDIINAILEIRENGVRAGRHSSTYDLIYEGKAFPPKLVISIANRYRNGVELDSHDFAGGKDTPAFELLKKEGFEIVEKNISSDYQVINEYISKIKVGEIKAADSILNLITSNNFGDRLSKVDQFFFDNRLNEINSTNYSEIIDFIKEIHSINGNYNDFNIWSAAKNHLLKNNPKLIPQHDELNKKLGFADNQNGIYKSFLGEKNLIAFINNKYNNNSHFDIARFQSKLKYSGLIFNPQLINRFIASLCTKPFVICSGLSGSGKTKLAQAFVHWISESDKQYKIIPVGADWTNREPLLGYPNGLEPKSYVTPDSGALQLILEASKLENKIKPYFLILDEMNLSHVERYFADFLSIMESKEKLKLYSDGKRYSNYEIGTEPDETNLIPQEIVWPENLFIIGTVNIDETTYMFSPKVLDRANVIEFRIKPKEMQDFLENSGNTNIAKLHMDEIKENPGIGSIYGTDFIRITKNSEDDEIENVKLVKLNELNIFFKELQAVGAEFGYRTAAEIKLLVHLLNKNDDFITDYIKEQNDGELVSNKQLRNHKIDIAIMQKLLPKLHGSRKKLVHPLEKLAGFCINRMGDSKPDEQSNNKTLYQQFISEKRDSQKWEIIYPISFEKIERMHKNVIENGFTSYAEA